MEDDAFVKQSWYGRESNVLFIEMNKSGKTVSRGEGK